ncbi:hypothetical protein EDD18DRAFT_1143591 [Armillaria luteobubalina]|uniref:Uncharacterized protein n=1 Tax=Armillaria luteobubalina TaxID=153913 RepID=A0AA39QFZ8_9AGAR|nr:hypothetical protein EDD18DRAFT_1143591 [Armillaria luteobubalina]
MSLKALSPHLFLKAIPELQHLPRSLHQFILPSVRRVFLDTSPQVEDLKRRLKVAEDRLEEQSASHALTMVRLTQRLELEATKKRLAVCLEMIRYNTRKCKSLRDDLNKSCSSPLLSGTVSVKRKRSDSSGDLRDENRKPSVLSSSLPPLMRRQRLTPRVPPKRPVLCQSAELPTLIAQQWELFQQNLQILREPFPTFAQFLSD